MKEFKQIINDITYVALGIGLGSHWNVKYILGGSVGVLIGKLCILGVQYLTQNKNENRT